MIRTALLVLALLLVRAQTSEAAPPAAPAAGPDRAAVDGAIERGVRRLLEEQRPDGSFGTDGPGELGETAISVLALLHAGLREDGKEPEDARLARAMVFLDRQGKGRDGRGDRALGTYAASLLLLVLEVRGRESDRPRMQRLVEGLCAAQAKNGQWGYQAEPNVGDNSNSQFAVLALGAAVGAGLDVPAATRTLARAWWLRTAGDDGGFGYDSGGAPGSASRGSMTCAGISSLAILEAAAGDATRTAEVAAAREKSLKWLTERFTVDKNPGSAPAISRARVAGLGWTFYYLWALERACVLAGVDRLGDHDWFAEGTARLLSQQRKDGSWVEKTPLADTCFALLFLTRAADPPRAFTSPPKPLGPTTPGPDAPASPAPPAPVVGPADPWADPPLAPPVLVERALAEGPSSLARLVRALDDPDPKVRQRAFEALTTLLGPERVEGADRRPLPRGRLALWVRRQARFLVAKDGRFALP